MVDPVSVWSIDLCRNWRRVGTVDSFEFRGVERWLEPGEWTLECAASAVEWGTIYDPDTEQTVTARPDDVDTIRLVRDRKIAYAGYVVPVSEGVGGLERTWDDAGQRLAWSGMDLWDVLRRRIAFPDPMVEPPWTDAYHEVTAQASTAIATFAVDNMGVSAIPDRQIDGFAVTDEHEGPTGTWSARLQPLSDLIVRICQDAELGVWLTVDWDGEVTMRVGKPRDRSSQIVLSDQGDLSRVQTRRVGNSSTWVLAGGQGEGTSRVFRSADAGPTGVGRREAFTDQSGLATAGEVQSAANVQMRLGGETWSVYGEVTDETAASLRYGHDLVLGDLITIEVAGVRHKVPVTSAAFEISVERQVVRPMLGTASPDELRGLVKDVANLAARFNRDVA